MLQTNTTTYDSRLRLKSVEAPPSVHLPTGERAATRQTEVAIDDALAASFPASDPPAWNPGLARPRPVDTLRGQARDPEPVAVRDAIATGIPDPIDVSPPHRSERPLLHALISLAGAAGIALLVPFAILLVGMPIALAVRGVVEILTWLLSGLSS